MSMHIVGGPALDGFDPVDTDEHDEAVMLEWREILAAGPTAGDPFAGVTIEAQEQAWEAFDDDRAQFEGMTAGHHVLRFR